MATKSINAKSKRIDVRVPHPIVDAMEEYKADGESSAQFIVTALQGEIKRRQRKSKQSTE